MSVAQFGSCRSTWLTRVDFRLTENSFLVQLRSDWGDLGHSNSRIRRPFLRNSNVFCDGENRPFSRAKEPACRGRFCTRRSHRPPTKPGAGTRRRPSRNPTNPLAPLNKVPLGWRRLSAAMSFVSLRRTSSHAGRTALPSPSPRRRLSVEHFTAGCVLRITPDPR
jgi:hypothetical protein